MNQIRKSIGSVAWFWFFVSLLLHGCETGAGTSAVPVVTNGNSPNGGGLKTQSDGLGSPKGQRGKSVQPKPYEGPVWFTEVSKDAGIDFQHVSGDSLEKPFPAANGSGIAALDYDLDGKQDLYFATGANFPLDLQRSEPINRMYRQVGAIQFVDVTAVTGLGHNGYSAGLAVGDYDSDGFPDLYVTCVGPNCLFRNQGDGTFEYVEAGVEDSKWATSAAWLDYDEDGHPDLYVCNYAKWSWEKNPHCDQAGKARMHCGPRSVEPEKHLLLRNRGDGTFEEMIDAAGIGERRGRGQGVVAADINEDGHVDLYVGNDLNPNFLFFGTGQGRFDDATEISGAAFDFLGREQASMGVDVADVGADGRFDLFVTNFQSDYNTLYENLGRGIFQDATNRFGLVKDALPWVGWGTAFVDFNLDGWLDLIVTNGHVDSNREQHDDHAPYLQPPLLFQGSRNRFTILGAEAGEYFSQRYAGRGLVVVDLDNDGDQDIVIGHQDKRPSLLRNERLAVGDAPGTSLVIRLIGTRGNRDAVGATVTVRTGERVFKTPIKGGGSYLSASDQRVVVATLPGETSFEVEIHWPGGRVSHATELEAGSEYVILEPRTTETSVMVHRRAIRP